MTVDPPTLAAGLIAAVPFARTIGIEIADVRVDGDDISATATLPDEERLHNHVAGPHAGAIFTLAETASGAVVMAAFGEHLALGTPLAVRSEIAYRKLAVGPGSAVPCATSSPSSPRASAPSSPSRSRSHGRTAP
jgi:uncharacterized protein DUF4442